MTVFHANPAAFFWDSGAFHPRGPFERITPLAPMQTNPVSWRAGDSKNKTLAARVIVGFNVEGRPTWNMDDFVQLVKQLREEQAGDPSASFIAQKGIYKHADPAHGVVIEEGAQILIINTDPQVKRKRFTTQMIELAERIAAVFQQESVFVEIQVNGVTKQVMGVTP